MKTAKKVKQREKKEKRRTRRKYEFFGSIMSRGEKRGDRSGENTFFFLCSSKLLRLHSMSRVVAKWNHTFDFDKSELGAVLQNKKKTSSLRRLSSHRRNVFDFMTMPGEGPRGDGEGRWWSLSAPRRLCTLRLIDNFRLRTSAIVEQNKIFLCW